jgi:hypothetical protein
MDRILMNETSRSVFLDGTGTGTFEEMSLLISSFRIDVFPIKLSPEILTLQASLVGRRTFIISHHFSSATPLAILSPQIPSKVDSFCPLVHTFVR